MRLLKTQNRRSNKIYNSKLTMNKNMKSSTMKIFGQSIDSTVDFDQRIDLVKLRFNLGF